MFDRSGRQIAHEGALRQMLALLRHRGPDEFGILLDQETGLGSARLSIIDLAGGSQPIANEDNSLWIVFNGEIFNYIELRSELQSQGHLFRTSSDTEVILHLFEEYGTDCLSRLNGQFAIAIWDSTRRRLLLARDRLGVRPLFYTQAGNTLLFASELKAILADRRVAAELDPVVIEQVFRFWGPSGSATVFRGIFQLPPGHFLTADRHSLRVQQYWEQDFPPADHFAPGVPDRGTTEALAEELRSLLVDACQIRLRADVPVGAYLSGGLDSSTIASIVRRRTTNRLVTFSIAFNDEAFDESKCQKQMAAHLGTDHHVLETTYEQIGEAFPEVIWHTELPVMRTAPVPMFLLSKLVRDTGFKVVLTGEGADEFLAGYDIFKEDKIRRFWARQPESATRPLLMKKLYADIRSLAEGHFDFLAAFFRQGLTDVTSPWYSHAVRWRNNARTLRFFQEHVLQENKESHLERLAGILPAAFNRWEPLARAQFLESSIFLSQYLLCSQGDRMGMAHSIEGRFPFLDVRVVEFCNKLPPRLKLRCLDEKFLLKKAAQPFLPAEIRQRPKRPYRAPIHRSLCCSSTADYIGELLAPASLAASGIFRPQAVEGLLKRLRAGAVLGETDDMALAGIVSTQLVHQLFIKRFARPAPLSDADPVKVCRVLNNRESARARGRDVPSL
jgi:asparagine synthase (glutamine-hydrolysing)